MVAFSKFWLGGRNPYEIVHDRFKILWGKKLPSKLGKWTENGLKTGFFQSIEKFGH